MRVDAFDFELPDALIALRPVRPRDAARLFVVREDGVAREVLKVAPATAPFLFSKMVLRIF